MKTTMAIRPSEPPSTAPTCRSTALLRVAPTVVCAMMTHVTAEVTMPGQSSPSIDQVAQLEAERGLEPDLQRRDVERPRAERPARAPVVGSGTSIGRSISGVSSVMRWPPEREAPSARGAPVRNAIRPSERSIPSRTGAWAATAGPDPRLGGDEGRRAGRAEQPAPALERAGQPRALLADRLEPRADGVVESHPCRRGRRRLGRPEGRGEEPCDLEDERGVLGVAGSERRVKHFGIGEKLQLRRQVAERQHRRRWPGRRGRRGRDRLIDEPSHQVQAAHEPGAELVDGIVGPQEELRAGAQDDAHPDGGDAPQRHVDIVLGKLDVRERHEDIRHDAEQRRIRRRHDVREVHARHHREAQGRREEVGQVDEGNDGEQARDPARERAEEALHAALERGAGIGLAHREDAQDGPAAVGDLEQHDEDGADQARHHDAQRRPQAAGARSELLLEELAEASDERRGHGRHGRSSIAEGASRSEKPG